MHQTDLTGNGEGRAILLIVLMLTSLFIWIPSISASDGDGDGYDDSADDCPYAAGNSTIDRVGCPDSDGDGTSDVSQGTVSDFDGADYSRTVSTSSSRSSMSRTIAVAPNGMVVAGADSGDQVLLLGPAGNEIKTLLTINSNPRDLDFSANGSLLAVSAYEANNNASVHVFTMDWVNQSATLLIDLSANHYDDTFALRFSPDGDFLYVGGKDHNVTKYHTSNWTIAHIIETGDDVYTIKTSPDGSFVAFTHGEELGVHWTSNGTQFFNVHNHSGYTLALDWSPDGNWIVTGSSDNDVNVYHASNGTVHREFSYSSDVNEVAFNRAGTHLVLATSDNDPTWIMKTADWTLEAEFGDFPGGSGNGASGRRGARDVAWSQDETKIYFGARYYGRIYTFYSTDAYAWLGGDVTGELMESRFQEYADNNSDYIPMHYNSTVTQVTQNQCSGFNPMGDAAPLIGASSSTAAEGLTTPLANYSTSGMRDCDITGTRLIEIPVARMPASVIVGPGEEEQCMRTIGGLTMAQMRWLLSGASESDLTSNSGFIHPGINWNSVVPNDDGNGEIEWIDLHPSCQDEPIHIIHRWENRSVTQMISSLIFCDHCNFPEDWFAEDFDRLRTSLIEEHRGDIINGVAGNDKVLGFTELRVALDSPSVYNVPMYDSWTLGAADAAAAGGTLIHPSVENSSNGLWPFQDDYRLVIREDNLDILRPFISWMLSEAGQENFDNIGFVRLDDYSRVLAGDRIGIDLRGILPDDDGDGVWNGDDDCDAESGTSNTNPADYATVDEFGCADSQRDSDGDGRMDDVDDCREIYGTSFQPTVGCPDSDGDGWADTGDAFWEDETQWADQDGDTFGDNPTGDQADSCPSVSGTSVNDRFGCIDSDGDGYSDPTSNWTVDDGADEFKDDPSQWVDADGDTVGDNYTWIDSDGDGISDIEIGDAFPEQISQNKDRDGDNFGDHQTGYAPDSCPDQWGNSTMQEKLGCPDADGDGWADEDDLFPMEPTQYADTDGDGFGDSQFGIESDKCPATPEDDIGFVHMSGAKRGCAPSELDGDKDGYSDADDICNNTNINEPVNEFGCAEYEWDTDNDLYFDDVDWDKNDPTQWVDSDGDGYGNNTSGTNGDQCPDTPSDIVDLGLISTEDQLGCTDGDGDGWSDVGDVLPNNPTQWADSDGDGYYDNFDTISWLTDPMRENSNPAWPGQFVTNARDPDRCPNHSYTFQNLENPGCPLDIYPGEEEIQDSDSQGDNYNPKSDDDGGLSMIAIAVIAFGIILLIGLGGIATMILRRQKSPKGRRKTPTPSEKTPQAEDLQVVEEPIGPENDPSYKVDEHGCEWWVDEDGVWWYRLPEMEDWAEYQG